MAEVGVGLVGYGFMGQVHSNAYRQIGRFFEVDPVPRMRAICGRDAAAVRQAAHSLGWEGYETDYRQLVGRSDIGLVDVATPGSSHHGIAVAALEAGKHVLCEKPLANTLDEAREMVEAARRAGTVNMVNFNYRRVPAVAFAKRLIEEGRIGEIRHWRAVYLQDLALDPELPLVWRFRKEEAGSGALGDLGAHLVDLAHYLVGTIASVVGTTKTFIGERPLEDGVEEMGEVTVDDATTFLASFENGATGIFEATRLAPGSKNRNAFEINGSEGSIAFDLERMNELEVYFAGDAAEVGGFRTVLVTEPEHPYLKAWWPAGHTVGYEHTFIHAVKDLLDGIRAGESPVPTFEDGYRCQAVLDAVERSEESGSWTRPAVEAVT
ncbi:MAG: Gfo/Idh/MocA family protein [Rubrobacteraceae bacterium]